VALADISLPPPLFLLPHFLAHLRLKLQITPETYAQLGPSQQANFVRRDTVCVKGKGMMSTYLLLSKQASAIRRSVMGFPGQAHLTGQASIPTSPRRQL
jgi:hypothetical protein